MRTPEETAALYEKAAAYVREHGLAKRNFELPDGRVCATGALARAAGMGALVIVQKDDLLDPLAKMLGWPGRGVGEVSRLGQITDWNDTPERTAEEVAVMLERTAAAIRHQAATAKREVARMLEETAVVLDRLAGVSS